MTGQSVSPIIAKHLDALVRMPNHGIPASFFGATGERQEGIYVGAGGLISTKDVRPAMAKLSPASLFIAYAQDYVAQPNLFQRNSVKTATQTFLGILHSFIK